MIKFLKKYHKWIGIISVFFILNFSISGVLLNHRRAISDIEIARKWLPEKYRFKNWNNGAVKSTLKLSADSILLYGGGGVWLSDSMGKSFESFATGMKKGIENRSLRSIVKIGREVFGISTYELYRLDNERHWQVHTDKIKTEAAFTDLCVKEDTLFVITRSHIFKSGTPYTSFEKTSLKAATDYKPEVSLFKTIWVLHSGEVFGLLGKIIIDVLGIIIIVITLSGLALTLLRIPIRHRLKKKQDAKQLKKRWKFSLKWHNKLGYTLFFLLLILVISGTFLRPPLLIPIARAKVPAIPHSTLDSANPWNEKLRVLRYDSFSDRWVLYSSDGFYTFSDFSETPSPVVKKPPVSVMGVTVLEQINATDWLVGSFSGMYSWNAYTGAAYDAFTGKKHEDSQVFGPPSFDNPINGYSNDFALGKVAFDYRKGAISLEKNTTFFTMPSQLEAASMSLWHVALELHVGRMYSFLGGLGSFFIFFSGLLFLFILVSGCVVYRRKHKKRKITGIKRYLY